jgi:hypothetical protein
MTNLEKEGQDACASALRKYGFGPKRRVSFCNRVAANWLRGGSGSTWPRGVYLRCCK